jgi:hypothetical protein
LKQLNFTKPSIIDFISKLEVGSRLNIDTNDLNLFIPINFTETEIKNIVQPCAEQTPVQIPLTTESVKSNSSRSNYSASEINKELQELQAKIALLDEMKHNERSSLDKIKENIKSKEEQVFLEKVKTETIKQKIEQKKEYYNKTKAKFKIDKDIYLKIKKEIEDGERHPEKLPELFVEEFKIFSKMESENMLDLEESDDAFKEYIKYKPDKKKNFVTVFDNIFDNDNWGNKNFVINKDGESNGDVEHDNSDSDDSYLEINKELAENRRMLYHQRHKKDNILNTKGYYALNILW